MKKPKYELGEQITMPAQITRIITTSQDELEYGVELFDDVFDESEIDEYNSKLNNPDDSLLTEDVEACKEQKSKLESEKVQLSQETSTNRVDTSTNTSTDLISRQAAIEEIKNATTITGWNKYASQEEIVDDVERQLRRLFVGAIESLPPVEPQKIVVGQVTFDAEEIVERIKEEYQITERPKGEWVSCSEPPKDRRNVFIAHGTNDFKSCCIGHYEQGMGWYEDRNFFAKPIYDCKYWCDIPELPDLGNNQFGTEVSADMRGDSE